MICDILKKVVKDLNPCIYFSPDFFLYLNPFPVKLFYSSVVFQTIRLFSLFTLITVLQTLKFVLASTSCGGTTALMTYSRVITRIVLIANRSINAYLNISEFEIKFLLWWNSNGLRCSKATVRDGRIVDGPIQNYKHPSLIRNRNSVQRATYNRLSGAVMGGT